MARVAVTGPMVATAARQMRRTAQQLDTDHPEMIAGDHLRDAARVLEHGSTDGAKRHLDAAMELLTPRNLIRHGIRDDEGHSVAKRYMHQAHRHRLHVQDIEDARGRNDRLRAAARGEPEPGERLMGNTVDLVGPHGYVHGWQYVGGPGLSRPRDEQFGAGTKPGSFEHLRAIEELGDKAEKFYGDPEVSSPTMKTALYHVSEAVARRDIRAARAHLKSAKWANQHEAQGIWARDLAELEQQLDRVPRRALGWENPRTNPLMARMQHLGKYKSTGPTPADPTRNAMLLQFSARTAMLERTPAPRGRPGGPGLYDVAGMGHTAYLQQIVKALIEKRGMPEGKAYAIARAAIRKWMRGGGHVHPEVMAAAGKAEAGELARQARAKASHGHAAEPWEVADALIELATTIDLFNPYHAPPGSPAGGQFTAGQQQGQGKQGKARQRAKLQARAASIRRQIAALRAMLPARHPGSRSRSSTPAKRGAAATSAKQAAQSRQQARQGSQTATARRKTMSPATIHAKILALRAELAGIEAQLRRL